MAIYIKSYWKLMKKKTSDFYILRYYIVRQILSFWNLSFYTSIYNSETMSETLKITIIIKNKIIWNLTYISSFQLRFTIYSRALCDEQSANCFLSVSTWLTAFICFLYLENPLLSTLCWAKSFEICLNSRVILLLYLVLWL